MGNPNYEVAPTGEATTYGQQRIMDSPLHKTLRDLRMRELEYELRSREIKKDGEADDEPTQHCETTT